VDAQNPQSRECQVNVLLRYCSQTSSPERRSTPPVSGPLISTEVIRIPTNSSTNQGTLKRRFALPVRAGGTLI